MDRAFGNWLAGFIDGEGSFGIRPGGGRIGYHSFCFFVLEVRHDDEAIIREIHDRTGIGSVGYRKKRDNPNHHDQISWRVTSGPDCVELAELLNHHPLRSKKRRAFDIWRIALDDQMCHCAAGPGKRRNRDGYEEHDARMLQYKSEIQTANQYAPAGAREGVI